MNQTIAVPVRADVGECVKLKDADGHTIATFSHTFLWGRRDPDAVVAFARGTATALNHHDRLVECVENILRIVNWDGVKEFEDARALLATIRDAKK